MTQEQKEALAWARSTGLLVRTWNGVWRATGARQGDDEFETETIIALVREGHLTLDAAGAHPATISVNLPFERLPQCACDPGTGKKPPLCTCGARGRRSE